MKKCPFSSAFHTRVSYICVKIWLLAHESSIIYLKLTQNSLLLQGEAISSTMTKVEIAKDTYLFCHSGGANSIKTNLHTCNLHTGQSINYNFVNKFCRFLAMLLRNHSNFYNVRILAGDQMSGDHMQAYIKNLYQV